MLDCIYSVACWCSGQVNCFGVQLPIFQELNVHELLVPLDHLINSRGGHSHHLGNAPQHAKPAWDVLLKKAALDGRVETTCAETIKRRENAQTNVAGSKHPGLHTKQEEALLWKGFLSFRPGTGVAGVRQEA